MGKVRRGEQQDPTGQYVKDGTTMPADAERSARPKLDAARDKFPFRIKLDGTVVLLPQKESTGTGNRPAPDQPPFIDCTTQYCPPQPSYPPVPTSTFVTSVGLGGTGDIVDMKVLYDGYSVPGYGMLNADLNKGAGGSYIYYYFTRLPNSVFQGKEYYLPNDFPNLSTSDPVVAYDSKTTDGFLGFHSVPQAEPNFAPIWFPDPNASVADWPSVDLNQGSGGKYIYSYQSKKLGAILGATPFHEIGILSGNSDQIQPPAGWRRWGQDLNEGAGGDYIYFCFKQ